MFFHGTGSLHLCSDVFVFFFAAVLVGRSCYGSGVAVSAFSIAMVRRIFKFHIFPANQRSEHPRVQSFALIIDRSYQFNHAGARLSFLSPSDARACCEWPVLWLQFAWWLGS